MVNTTRVKKTLVWVSILIALLCVSVPLGSSAEWAFADDGEVGTEDYMPGEVEMHGDLLPEEEEEPEHEDDDGVVRVQPQHDQDEVVDEQDDDTPTKSHSKSHAGTQTHTKSKSKTRGTKTESKTKSKNTKSKSKSKAKTKTRSKSRSKGGTKSRSKGRVGTKSQSHRNTKTRTRTLTHSRSKTGTKTLSKSLSRHARSVEELSVCVLERDNDGAIVGTKIATLPRAKANLAIEDGNARMGTPYGPCDVDECIEGTAKCPASAECINTSEGYECNCNGDEKEPCMQGRRDPISDKLYHYEIKDGKPEYEGEAASEETEMKGGEEPESELETRHMPHEYTLDTEAEGKEQSDAEKEFRESVHEFDGSLYEDLAKEDEDEPSTEGGDAGMTAAEVARANELAEEEAITQQHGNAGAEERGTMGEEEEEEEKDRQREEDGKTEGAEEDADNEERQAAGIIIGADEM
eukprot:TRINITY_DN16267_c0_g2_i1.p1 TRINITY_DN16267_c0_g2~~TRINITY_DN16267_c0_g2_i1.p1  ORF type:complete len:463 (-),score=133.62 TRINITY_DN16267_c0_g2_i1:242-1630(-)